MELLIHKTSLRLHLYHTLSYSKSHLRTLKVKFYCLNFKIEIAILKIYLIKQI